jgi:hypothetical protein
MELSTILLVQVKPLVVNKKCLKYNANLISWNNLIVIRLRFKVDHKIETVGNDYDEFADRFKICANT